ncbi:unnamed protein product [Lactuca saligna]|uniref:PB1-like domain-containing protein n=1 Tax=Lactuca saligna TaxID=75948 RepID=A0AA35Y4L4_LACSI|nr:unnamed protein product [Lactuca saligna]
MVGWRIRADMAEIDVGRVTFPGRRYKKGKVKYVDLVDIDEFSIHDIDEMMNILGCVEEGKLLYYHFKRPLLDLDIGLFALAYDSDINHLRTYVGKYKLIEVYTDHGKTMLNTYLMSPNPSKVRIKEIIEPPACSERLFLEWKASTTGDCSGSMTPEVDQCGKPPNEPQFQTQGFDQDFTSFVQNFDQDFTTFVQDEVNRSEDIRVHGDDLTDNKDNDFLLDKDNMIDEPDIDMKEFFLNID